MTVRLVVATTISVSQASVPRCCCLRPSIPRPSPRSIQGQQQKSQDERFRICQGNLASGNRLLVASDFLDKFGFTHRGSGTFVALPNSRPTYIFTTGQGKHALVYHE
ncbi:hypothetical protein BJX68DRAFT_229738 [Aspergillus pseudodeflectus]|uniref:Uncharacterized protein n=1 Tax=Aspergillus pseudodeflectus TaxID=176178 RepID=A0ABR4KXC8_9EURO